MLNIPMNFNVLNSTQLGTNTSNLNQNLNDTGDFMGIEFNIKSSKVSDVSNIENYDNRLNNLKTDTELADDIKDIVSSFEDVLNKLIEEDEELTLNEDISFLQSIIALFNQNNTDDMDNNSLYNSDINTDFMIKNSDINTDFVIDKSLKNTNFVAESNISLDNNWQLLNNELTLNKDLVSDSNLLLDSDLALEFIQELDDNFIENFKKLDTIDAKKEVLIKEFKEFILLQDSSSNTNVELDDFYSAFKTNLKLSTDNNSLKDSTLESLNSNDIIELLGNNSITVSDKSLQEVKFKDLDNLVLHQETLIDDLQDTLVQMKNYNLRQLKIKLSPKELGDMTIDISQVNDISNIKLILSNKETLDLVESNLKEIIEHLRESNLISKSSSITVEADTSQSKSFSSSFEGYSLGNKSKQETNFDEAITDESNYTSIDADIKKDSNTNILNILA